MELFQLWLFLTVTLRERWRGMTAGLIGTVGLWLLIDGARGGGLDTRVDFDPQRFFLGLVLMLVAAFIFRSRPRPWAQQAKVIARFGHEPKRPWRAPEPPAGGTAA